MVDIKNQRPDPMTHEEEAEALFPQITTIKESWQPTLCHTSVSERDCKAIKSAFVYDDLVYEAEQQDVW